MVRKIVSATVSAALCCWSVAPAHAQSYAAHSNAPQGVTATANLRLPLGVRKTSGPTYGLTFGVGKPMGAGYDGRLVTRELRLADIRFSGSARLERAQVASFDLANLDKDKRMNLMGGDNTLLIVAGVVAIGVGVCLLAECFDDDDDDDDDDDG